MMRFSYEEPMVRKPRENRLASPFIHDGRPDVLGQASEKSEGCASQNMGNNTQINKLTRRSDFNSGFEFCGKSGVLGDVAIAEHIARELRGIYEPVVAQPTPQRFIELLNKLEAETIFSEKQRAPKE